MAKSRSIVAFSKDHKKTTVTAASAFAMAVVVFLAWLRTKA